MLIRRLREDGTTDRELREAHRRKLAIELLSDTALTAAEIAYRLGYEDASNFGKAWVRMVSGRAAQAAARTTAYDPQILAPGRRRRSTRRGRATRPGSSPS